MSNSAAESSQFPFDFSVIDFLFGISDSIPWKAKVQKLNKMKNIPIDFTSSVIIN